MAFRGFVSEAIPSLFAGPRPARKVLAGSIATLVIGCSLYVGVVSSIREAGIVFHAAPLTIVPPPLVSQVDMVRKIVPGGSFIIYLMEKPDVWRFGLWKRALFPDYTILPLASSTVLTSPWVKAFRIRHKVRYLVVTGYSLPVDSRNVTLPEYPPGTTTVLEDLEK